MQHERGILDRAEVEKLLDACRRDYAGARLRSAVALMYRTGMRPGEMLGLELGDIRMDSQGRMIARVNRPKGHAKIKSPSPPRELYMDDRATAYYHEWMRRRGAKAGPIFCNRWGCRMTRQSFGRELRSAARRAGIEKRVHPHGIRHSFAHDYYYETMDVGALSGILGHRRAATTFVYLQNIGCAPRVIASMEAREW